MVSQVSILGSGNVGANTAFFIAETGVEEVLLYDLQEGLAIGKALDMMEAAPLRKYRNRLRGAAKLEQIAGSEIVVLAAGRVRRPGMKREDLFAENRELVGELAPRLKELAPEAVVVVATEPVDPITREFVHASGFPRQRVLGVGGCLDATRLRYAVARELGVSMEDVSAMVIGRHSGSMLALPRYCSVSGVPLPQLLSPERIQALTAETAGAGDLIVQMAQRSSAFYAPSAAVADIVNCVHMDLRRVLCLSLVLQGEYGLSGVALSLPAVLGRGGVRRVLTPRLTQAELQIMKRSAAELAELARQAGAKPGEAGAKAGEAGAKPGEAGAKPGEAGEAGASSGLRAGGAA
jgi:malate dehydrogenase